jgi:hypothetical protein
MLNTTAYRLMTKCRGTPNVYDSHYIQPQTVLPGVALCNVEETFARSPWKSFRRLTQQTVLSLQLLWFGLRF